MKSCGLPGLGLASSMGKQNRTAAGVMTARKGTPHCAMKSQLPSFPQKRVLAGAVLDSHAHLPTVYCECLTASLPASCTAPLAFSAAKETIYLG